MVENRSIKVIALVFILVLIVSVISFQGYMQKPTGESTGATLVLNYEDGGEETINVDNSFLCLFQLPTHSVLYRGKAVNKLAVYWDITATVDSSPGTCRFPSYTVWVQESKSSIKMSQQQGSDMGPYPLGQKHTLRIPSSVDSQTVQRTLGSGSFRLDFYLKLTTSAEAQGQIPKAEALKTVYVSVFITVTSGATGILTVDAAAQGVKTT